MPFAKAGSLTNMAGTVLTAVREERAHDDELEGEPLPAIPAGATSQSAPSSFRLRRNGAGSKAGGFRGVRPASARVAPSASARAEAGSFPRPLVSARRARSTSKDGPDARELSGLAGLGSGEPVAEVERCRHLDALAGAFGVRRPSRAPWLRP